MRFVVCLVNAFILFVVVCDRFRHAQGRRDNGGFFVIYGYPSGYDQTSGDTLDTLTVNPGSTTTSSYSFTCENE